MSDETASLDVINSNTQSIRGVQGRNDSPSGVEGSFTFDVIHEFRRVKIGQIKLMFDVPWGGFGYGDNTAKFFISTSDDPKKIEVVKNYVLNKHQQNRINKGLEMLRKLISDGFTIEQDGKDEGNINKIVYSFKSCLSFEKKQQKLEKGKDVLKRLIQALKIEKAKNDHRKEVTNHQCEEVDYIDKILYENGLAKK
ncbi:44931_t:CDS:2 [Gigaspora margarita]|uniref:44931_t:CDS:1 n=1 Tax=Gigaspora margarita TaxID=4874 RepID=A0ABM8VYZ1_GIGMA|nr:44931_t:CDS:2 [Gigaspora margarita]